MTLTQTLGSTVFGLITQLSLCHLALAAESDIPLDQVYIKNFTASGSGCRAGTFEKNLSPDKKAFTMTYSNFIAQISPWTAPSEARKNCSITLTLNIPAGFQYTVGTFNYRGAMDLDENVRANFNTVYFFEGVGETGNFTKVETGPLTKDFVYSDKVGITSAYVPSTWSPCTTQRALIINPTISLVRLAGANPNAESLITNDSTDGEIVQEFGLAYRRCGESTVPNPTPYPTPEPTPDPTPEPTPNPDPQPTPDWD